MSAQKPFGDEDWIRVTCNAMRLADLRNRSLDEWAINARYAWELDPVMRERAEKYAEDYAGTILGAWEKYERETLIPRGEEYVIPNEVVRLRAAGYKPR